MILFETKNHKGQACGLCTEQGKLSLEPDRLKRICRTFGAQGMTAVITRGNREKRFEGGGERERDREREREREREGGGREGERERVRDGQGESEGEKE